MLTDTITFAVDYNDREPDGALLASMRFASSPWSPESGDLVWTADDEGNGCWGTVRATDGLLVTIDLDRATWTRQVEIDMPSDISLLVEEDAETSRLGLELV
jgi:hypothetical protein